MRERERERQRERESERERDGGRLTGRGRKDEKLFCIVLFYFFLFISTIFYVNLHFSHCILLLMFPLSSLSFS